MGTSSSYGGSTKKDWKKARQQILDLGGGGGDGPDKPDRKPDEDERLEDLWNSIGDALDSDDPTLHAPDIPHDQISTASIMPWLRGGSGNSGGGGGGGGAGGARTGGGRQGRGSRRAVLRSAARGGTVLGAAHAVRQGDAAYLSELGLDLDRLRGLSVPRQCAEILDAVLGEGAHPDEAALRKASLETLKEVLGAGASEDAIESVRSFVSNYVFELSLVELQKQVREADLTPQQAAEQEKKIRSYLVARVRGVAMPSSGRLQPRDLREVTTRLTKEVVKVLRSRKRP